MSYSEVWQATGVLPTPDDIHPHCHLSDQMPELLPLPTSSLSPLRASPSVVDPNLAPEHAPRQVVDPQLILLSQASQVRDPEVIQRQRGGERG